jgi:tetratricopeptide (TPR) repeat protein
MTKIQMQPPRTNESIINGHLLRCFDCSSHTMESVQVSSATPSATAIQAPVVTRDPRFHAGRQLVQKGLAAEGAVDIFAMLVEETVSKYDSASVEAAPAYYEYGNALLRAASKAQEQPEQPEIKEQGGGNPRQRLAKAAEERIKQQQQQQQIETVNDQDDSKPPAKVPSLPATLPAPVPATLLLPVQVKAIPTDYYNENKKSEAVNLEDKNEASAIRVKEEADEDEIYSSTTSSDDFSLALEMMENAYSILDNYQEQGDSNYKEWVSEQLPRVLLGIADALSAMGRHADAADAYSRVLEKRSMSLEQFPKSDLSLPHLIAHRKVVEATILIAEELLAHQGDEDVVTTETNTLIVKADERVEYARGYYDQARDALQETVYYMATLAAKNITMGSEKADVCFIGKLELEVTKTSLFR